ncbi:MAG: cytochrome c-type biogenesis protein CcmE [Roseibaca calidilacus]|uniref:Cytochrome c-type biogenesis protein CcmE n=1 Tax=Roseibaca calidilacus TaxID=1666912 RepID=A0A0P7WC94_9RHOB|nr:cytochrome c maturation protein CcmE [Roseibaca calidilacus]KPP91775.1 MAG: cytochrome c-type biogenesis protein CcmE [Roseibaca calidilacus]CUX82537.1 cytochrome c-type biogenesis protein CcmE [Roseibaca calidilacus]
MKSLKKTRRIQIIAVAAVALTLSTALIGYAMRDGINFFRSPSQVVEAPPPATEVFRIGGLVEPGSIVRGQSDTVRFRVTDGPASVEVTYRGILPDLFSENEGMVGTGRFVNGVFEASEILAKHDETYMPREVMEALKEQGEWRGPDPQAEPRT